MPSNYIIHQECNNGLCNHSGGDSYTWACHVRLTLGRHPVYKAMNKVMSDASSKLQPNENEAADDIRFAHNRLFRVYCAIIEILPLDDAKSTALLICYDTLKYGQTPSRIDSWDHSIPPSLQTSARQHINTMSHEQSLNQCNDHHIKPLVTRPMHVVLQYATENFAVQM